MEDNDDTGGEQVFIVMPEFASVKGFPCVSFNIVIYRTAWPSFHTWNLHWGWSFRWIRTQNIIQLKQHITEVRCPNNSLLPASEPFFLLRKEEKIPFSTLSQQNRFRHSNFVRHTIAAYEMLMSAVLSKPISICKKCQKSLIPHAKNVIPWQTQSDLCYLNFQV